MSHVAGGGSTVGTDTGRVAGQCDADADADGHVHVRPPSPPPSPPVYQWHRGRQCHSLTMHSIRAAGERLSKALAHTPTPLTHSSQLSHIVGMEVYIKREFEQVTGSFKERGVCYALLRMSPGERARGAVAASAGNHALALSYYGHKLGIGTTVVMPHTVPHHKVDQCMAYGAKVVVHGEHFGQAVDMAIKLAHERQLTYIDDYDNVHVLSGAGSISLEVCEQFAQVHSGPPDAIVVPVGGAGLLAGVAVAAKAIDSSVRIVAAEPAAAASMHAALRNKAPVDVHVQPNDTVADVLVVPRVGATAYFACHQLVDSSVVVQDEWIVLAMHLLHKYERVKVEGAGATALAALLAGLCNELKMHRVVVIASGGNISDDDFAKAIGRGEALEQALLGTRSGSAKECARAEAEHGDEETRRGGAPVQLTLPPGRTGNSATHA